MYVDSLPHRTLVGHSGSVTCLVYPYGESPRYDASQLVSGGVDFTIILWDMFRGTKLHSFCAQGGDIQQLLVPPDGCNVSGIVVV